SLPIVPSDELILGWNAPPPRKISEPAISNNPENISCNRLLLIFSSDLLRRLMPTPAPPSAPAPYSRLPRNRASAPTLPAVSFCHALRATTCRYCGNGPIDASLPGESPLRTLSRPAGPQAARRRDAEAARGKIS